MGIGFDEALGIAKLDETSVLKLVLSKNKNVAPVVPSCILTLLELSLSVIFSALASVTPSCMK